MQHLLVVSIGPVQEFILSARRSRDFWYGSWLLSELSRTAARAVVEQCANDIGVLIFPKPAGPQDLEPTDPQIALNGGSLGIANKVVAIVPDAVLDIAGLAAETGHAVRRRLRGLASAIFDSIADVNLDTRALAEAQVEDLLEFYWAAQPLAPDLSDYAAVRAYLEALLAARKATRDFAQVRVPDDKGRPKSSLDGIRESVIPEVAYPLRGDSEQVRQDKVHQLYNLYGGGAAERLSGVDLLKRKGSAGAHFPSTSHFAALPFLKRVQSLGLDIETPLRTLLAGLRQQGVRPEEVRFQHGILLSDGRTQYDASLLYASRLNEDLETEAQRREVAKLLDRFYTTLDAGARPQPYYALLRADGDRMGMTIDALKDPQQHAAISAALNAFAAQVEGIVAQHEGTAVYSGGDDVLAFLPLHTALDCAVRLSDVFAAALAEFKAEDGQSPSLSVGIAVTHHVEPMSDALRLAADAEKAAKGVDGKDGLALIVSKRSGVDRLVVGPRKSLGPRLQEIAALHRAGAIPDGAAYQIEDMLVRLGQEPTAQAALRAEAKRILKRKPSLRGNRSEANLGLLLGQVDDQTIRMSEFINELIVTRLFADAMESAQPQEEKSHARA